MVQNALFADASKDKAKRSSLRQEVAEQMYELIQRFSGNAAIEKMTSYEQLLTVFEQQCEVTDVIDVPVENSDDDESQPSQSSEADASDEVTAESDDVNQIKVKKKTGGNVIQNPSDPDATYDGHKGPGYQVQLSETSNPENTVQLIVSAIPETAADPDSAATGKVLEDLENKGMLPDKLLADSLYGGDENVLSAEEKGVEVISPVAGPPPKKIPTKPTEKQIRLQARRDLQETDQWRKQYNSRAQIEGTIGSVKRRTGMVRLRVRGQSSVYASIFLKLAGWNIARAASSAKIQKILAEKVTKAINRAKQAWQDLLCSNILPFPPTREAI
jgi:hypothetical protein